MQPLNFNLVELFLILTMCLNIFRKPLIEQLVRIEQIWYYKVK